MHPKPVPERLAKRAPEKPKKTDNPTFNDQEKTPKQEPKLPPKATKEINPAQVEKKEPTEDKLKEEEKVRESEQKTDEPTLLEAHTEDANNIKPQAKAPPKFAIGLPIGHVQGDLLAEMKKRKEKGSNKVRASLNFHVLLQLVFTFSGIYMGLTSEHPFKRPF